MNTILVIEDELQMRANIAMILEMENFRVLGAENGRLGVEMARRDRPDVILCDMMMPELDGEGVLQELSNDAATRSIPFFFLSARGHTAFLRKHMPLPEERCLAKPITAEELLAAVRGALSEPSGRP